MSSAPSYSNILVGYIPSPIFVSTLFSFIRGNSTIYALDNYGNFVPPSFSTSSLSLSPAQISLSAAFGYPYLNFYLVMPYVYPMIISFDYPVKFVTINMSAQFG